VTKEEEEEEKKKKNKKKKTPALNEVDYCCKHRTLPWIYPI